MLKKLSLLAIALFCFFPLFSQKLNVEVNYVSSDATTDNNTIYYKPGEMLGWSDFKGRPVEGSSAAALTNAGFGIKIGFKRTGTNGQLLIWVNCNFSRKDSWVKKGNNTAYILNHEQKHFDIAYVHTMWFIQKLRVAPITMTNYAAEIEKIYIEAAGAMGKMQHDYDAETSHSRIAEKQAAWDLKVSGLLAAATIE